MGPSELSKHGPFKAHVKFKRALSNPTHIRLNSIRPESGPLNTPTHDICNSWEVLSIFNIFDRTAAQGPKKLGASILNYFVYMLRVWSEKIVRKIL